MIISLHGKLHFIKEKKKWRLTKKYDEVIQNIPEMKKILI